LTCERELDTAKMNMMQHAKYLGQTISRLKVIPYTHCSAWPAIVVSKNRNGEI